MGAFDPAATRPHWYAGHTYPKRTARKGRSEFRRFTLTAQVVSSNLGWAEIRHPYHPLCGQRLEVLKQRRVAGVDTLILRQSQYGTISIAREWTDWADPSVYEMLGWPTGHFEAESLLRLVTFLEQLQGDSKKC